VSWFKGMKRKLLLVHPGQFGYAAGYYHYCKYLSHFFDITILCFDLKLKKVSLDKVEVIYLCRSKSRFLFNLKFAIDIIRIWNNFKFDICICSYFRGVIVTRFFIRNPEFFILDIRTGSVSSSSIKRYFDDFIVRFYSYFFCNIMTLSESLCNKLKLPKNKTNIIPLGAEVCDISPKKYESLNLIYVGTFTGRRIEDTIIGFTDFVLNNKGQFSYDIVGFGSEFDVSNIKDAINKSEVKELIMFHGRLQYEEVLSLKKKCNVGVSYVPLTEYYECQPPTKTFEYVLSGMICIATETYENKFLINEKNGVLCLDSALSFSEALLKVYNLRSMYDFYQIIETLKNYEWSVVIKNKMLPYLKSVCAASKLTKF